GHEAVLGVQAHDHLAGERTAGFGHELGLLDRLGADDHVADAGLDVVLDGFQRADAAADLDRQVRVALGNGSHHLAVDRLAFEGTVQVDQVQAAAATVDPFGGHAHRVIGKYRGIFHTALAQTYASTVLE